MPAPAMSVEEVLVLLRAGFEGWERTGITVESVEHRFAKLRLKVGQRSLRPGGTVSGPAMFMLADTAFFVAVLASVGPEALAVTTQMSINFLKKPPAADLVAECRLLKLGSRLAVGEVSIFTEGDSEPVAHATGTYSIPPRRDGAIA